MPRPRLHDGLSDGPSPRSRARGDGPPQASLREVERHGGEGCRVAKLEMRMDDATSGSQRGGGGAEATPAQLPQQVPQVSFLPAVADSGARDRARRLGSAETLEPDRGEVGAGADGERHPAEGAWVEVDRSEPA